MPSSDEVCLTLNLIFNQVPPYCTMEYSFIGYLRLLDILVDWAYVLSYESQLFWFFIILSHQIMVSIIPWQLHNVIL